MPYFQNIIIQTQHVRVKNSSFFYALLQCEQNKKFLFPCDVHSMFESVFLVFTQIYPFLTVSCI